MEGILRFKIGWLKELALTVHVLMFRTGLIIGRIFASEIWGADFREGLFIYLFLGGGGAYYRNSKVYSNYVIIALFLTNHIAVISYPVLYSQLSPCGHPANTDSCKIPG